MAELTAPLFTSSGDRKGDVALDAAVFGLDPNVPVMHQVVTAQLAAARAGTASTKTRAEVRGGGAKPWRQKGLGRARHGSNRSPQWTGGGVVHGPKPRDYSQRTPKKMRRLALRSALSARAAQDQVFVVDEYDWDAPKTKTAARLLEAIGIAGKVLVVVGSEDEVARRAFRNLAAARVHGVGQINTYDVLWADAIILTPQTLRALTGSDTAVDEPTVASLSAEVSTLDEPTEAEDDEPKSAPADEAAGENDEDDA